MAVSYPYTTRQLSCPLCEREGRGYQDGSDHHISCPLCGDFRFTIEFHRDFRNDGTGREMARFISAAARQASEAGRPITLTAENWRNLAEAHQSVSISRKVESVLRFFASKCGSPGRVTSKFDFYLDYPVADCLDSHEFRQYVEYLVDKKLLKEFWSDDGESVQGYEPTIDGWQTVEPTLAAGGEPGRCFVAMSFSKELDDAYSVGIKPAIESCAMKCVCLRDGPARPDGITDRILSEIRLAQFTVADFTEQNLGVYFEAGFAKGLGRDVIWTCRADEVGKLHFDTRHLGHILWKTPEDLRAKLADSIRANILQPR